MGQSGMAPGAGGAMSSMSGNMPTGYSQMGPQAQPSAGGYMAGKVNLILMK